MKWHLRRSQKKYEEPEQLLDFHKPKKSILRAKGVHKDSSSQENGEDMGNMASFADIRSASSSRRNVLLNSNWMPQNEASVGLRSVDNRRRNVLFLDQVERNNRPSMMDQPISRSQASSPASSSNTYASYPTSYQPSPLFPKRDISNCDIELVSRAPLSSAESDNTNDTCASPRLKRWLRMSSFNQRWKQKYLDFHCSIDTADESENELPGLETLRRYPNTPQVISNPSQSNPARLDSSPGRINHYSGVATTDLQSSDAKSPVVRRPVRPQIVETQPPFLVYDGLKTIFPKSIAPSENGTLQAMSKSLQDVSQTETDSTETLRPQGFRKTPTYESTVSSAINNLRFSPSLQPTCDIGISPYSQKVSSQVSPSHSTQAPSSSNTSVSPWSSNRGLNNHLFTEPKNSSTINDSSSPPRRNTTKIVYAPGALKGDAQIGSATEEGEWQSSGLLSDNFQRSYKPSTVICTVNRSVSVSRLDPNNRY
ncbi:hypothetical protein CRM22_010122 [Opisthorchis felineus]|uniref:Uncharacterized protein n=1 Tax=Opisthorchis felineus TaxID=147828 RepID=A0A4S2L7W6_OPIFE|nr:hypothetical protein CRM22_010122 [Opisthorchis felineus]